MGIRFVKVNRATAARELRVGDSVKITNSMEDGVFKIKSITAEKDSVGLEFFDRDTGWYVGGPMDTYRAVQIDVCPQAKTVLKHLRQAGSISQVEAQAMYRVRSLTKRIQELRAEGHAIVSEWKRDPINKQRYVRYHLRQPVASQAAA